MKQGKTTLCILLVLLLCLGLFAGCGDTEQSTDPSPSPSASGVDDTGVFDFSAALTEEGFFKDIKASDLVTLPEYKGISIPASVTEASDEDVQAQIDILLQNHAEHGDPIMDRAVQDGDTLNIDYVGSVDGVEFEGGSTGGNGTEVTIGVTSYIDDFLEQLIGHMPGETFDIEVTFPDSYPNNPDLAGKDAVFNVTINHIVNVILPEFSDEFAKECEFDSAEDLLADLTAWLISTQKNNYFQNLMWSAEVPEIPEAVLNYVRDSDLAYYKSYANTYGTDLESLITSMTGAASVDEYLASQEEYYKSTATFYLACQAMAELEDLSVSQEDLDASGYLDAVETYGNPYIKMHVLQEIVCRDFVFDNAVIS